MTTMICFSIIILTLISISQTQYSYFPNASWNHSNRRSFMAPVDLYSGVHLPRTNHPTAPPIDFISPINNNQDQFRNNLFTTRTTYFFHSMPTTTLPPKRYYYYRRRNRTETGSLSTTNSANAQRFGIVVNVYEPVDTATTMSSSTQIPWWKLTTTVTQPTVTISRTFHERFPKLPSYIHRPPPPTVPRSFTASTLFTYPSSSSSTTTTATAAAAAATARRVITTTTTTTTTSSRPTSSVPLSRPSTPLNSSWLFTVPSFSQIIDQYPRYPTIIRWFEELSRHANISRFFAYETVGYTHENRSLIIAKIGLMPFRNNRRSIWLDGGIHAREWISTATILYTIARIINGTLARDPDVRKLIDKYDFYFMPVVNPDGYAYTHDDVKVDWDTNEEQDQQRMWRKNRRPHSDCPGVDLNRNFPFAWDNRGASKFPCEETYRGPYPESEPEVQAITSFILKRRLYFHAFITLHAFGNLWMLPFSFSTRIRPYDYHRAERLLIEMNRLSMNTFKIGQSSTVLYTATGTSEDWAKAIAQIPHTFSIELPPSTDEFDMRQDELNGFTFYANKDIGIVAESTYRLLELYFQHLAKLRYPSKITI